MEKRVASSWQPPQLSADAARRLALFAPNLYGGGAERVLAQLATHWEAQGRDVTIITLAAASPDDFPVPKTVRRIALDLAFESAGLFAGLRNNLSRIRALRQTLIGLEPDVVVSVIDQTNILALLAARPLELPVVIAERTDPAAHPLPGIWSRLRRLTYRRCAALVVLTKEIAAMMRPIVRGRPVVVIPNGIPHPTVLQSDRTNVRERTLIGLGRLSHEKGFERLIDAFGQLADKHPNWRLVIYGEGPARAELEELIHRRSLAERVLLPGRTNTPQAVLADADLFALPSRYEGFPMALLEAMSIGLPAVAFQVSGVRQIISDGRNGRIVPPDDVAAFARSLDELMSDDELRRTMSLDARSVAFRFSELAVFAHWDAVLDAAHRRDFSQLWGVASE